MNMTGFIDYQRREYCKDIRCPVRTLLDKQVENSPEHGEVRAICQTHCIHTTYEFHHWLITKGYLVVRPEQTP